MVIVAAQVKQATLVGIGDAGIGKINRLVNRCDQRCAVELQGVKRARFDQRFNRPLVQLAAVHTHAKVIQAGEHPTLLACQNHRLNRLLTSAFYSTQPVANLLVRDRLEAVVAPVDVGSLECQAHLDCVFKQSLHFVGVVHLHRHVGAEKFRRVMHLQPGGVIGQERVGSRVRLVEAVACELLHVVKNLIGLLLREAVARRAIPEYLALHRHFVGLFLAHGAAQHVGAAQRIAAQNLRHLHHLLLIHHHAVGVFENAFNARVGVLHRLAAELARNIGGDQVHRAGPVQRVHRNQVFQPRGFGVAQQALHAARFKLEN